jgi:hypothetical protein
MKWFISAPGSSLSAGRAVSLLGALPLWIYQSRTIHATQIYQRCFYKPYLKNNNLLKKNETK